MPVDSTRLLSAVMDGIDPGWDLGHSQGYYNILNIRFDPRIQQENINYVKLTLVVSFHSLPLNAAPCTV